MANARTVEGEVVENFVLDIAPDDTFSIEAYDY
jgi:hypothetical protein